MVEIKHRDSGRVFLQVEAETLERANLMGEYLIHADFQDTNLSFAQMAFANLSMANLAGANLAGANLSGANLTEADLTGTDLTGAVLSGATLSLTVFAKCPSLRHAKGLTTVRHPGPSTLDEPTLPAGRVSARGWLHAQRDPAPAASLPCRPGIVYFQAL